MSISRQGHLDSLRGIAALIVVIVHYIAAFYPYTIYGSQEEYLQHSVWENLFFSPPFGLVVSGHFAVCLFFILSGYVLSYRYLGEPKQGHKILTSIIKRPIRLGGLVWLTMICGALMWYFGLFLNVAVSNISNSKPWFNELWAGDFSFYKFIVDISTSSFARSYIYNVPLWTIQIELYGSIMVYIFVLVLGRFKYRFLVSIFLIIYFKDNLYQGFWIGLFIADIMKNRTSQSPIKFKNRYSCLLLILFIYFSSYPNYVSQEFLKGTIYAFLPDDRKFDGGYPMLSALLIFILAISNSRFKECLNLPFLQFLGRISYGMYAVHILVIGSLSSWLFLVLNSYLGYSLSFLVVLLSGLPLITLIAYLATRYIDNPLLVIANYIGEKATDIVVLLPIRKMLMLLKNL